MKAAPSAASTWSCQNGRHPDSLRMPRSVYQVVEATAGTEGSYWLALGNDTIRHNACTVLDGPEVDSDCAGDAFASAFLHAWFESVLLEACMRTG